MGMVTANAITTSTGNIITDRSISERQQAPYENRANKMELGFLKTDRSVPLYWLLSENLASIAVPVFIANSYPITEKVRLKVFKNGVTVSNKVIIVTVYKNREVEVSPAKP